MSCYSSSSSFSSSPPSSPTRKSSTTISNNDMSCAYSTSPRMAPLPPIELPLPTVPFSVVHFPPPPPPPAAAAAAAAAAGHPFHVLSPNTSPSLQPAPTSSPPPSSIISDRKKSQPATGNGLHHHRHHNKSSILGIDSTHSSSPTAGKTASERETHRRQSHSAIEKRRRERINDKIDQLKHLIPSCCPSPNTLPSASMHQPLHKLSVLQAAIDYIHQLHTQLIHHAPQLESTILLQQEASSDVELAKIVSHARRQHEQQMGHPPSLLHSP